MPLSDLPPAARWALRLLPLAIAALGPLNTFDAVVQGKWVRHWGTESGEHTATLCLPAASADELPALLGALPERLAWLRDAGVETVAIDLGDFGGDSAVVRGDLQVPAHGEMGYSLAPPAVLGALGERGGVWPFSLQALALREGADGVTRDGDALVVGDHRIDPLDDYQVFMPYEIPFLHWDRPEEWTGVAEGRTVFVGACRLDRELTRYGRQPGPVAHGEIVETIYDDVRPIRPGGLLDVLLALGVGLLAGALRPRAGLAACAGLGVAAVLGALVASQVGLWVGLSGLLLAALGWGLAATE